MTLIIIITPLIIILLLRLYMNSHNDDANEAAMAEFWEKERQARFARNADISNLQLYKPELDKLPFLSESAASSDTERAELEAKVIASAKEPMLDLHEYSNTDLKIKYGNGNFPALSKYDQNFMYFTRDVYQLAKYLYDNNYTDDARITLEYLTSVSAEPGGAFTMLAKIYINSGEPERINKLIQIIEASKDSIQKDATLRSLRQIINSYQ